MLFFLMKLKLNRLFEVLFQSSASVVFGLSQFFFRVYSYKIANGFGLLLEKHAMYACKTIIPKRKNTAKAKLFSVSPFLWTELI